MQRDSRTRRGVLAVAGGALAALAGCTGSGQRGTPTESDEPTPMGTPTEMGTEPGPERDSELPPGGDAMLRVAHLVPDAPNVDVAVDGIPVRTDVPFETVSGYLPLTTGEHRVTVTLTDGSGAVFDGVVTLDSGPQTAAAIGELSGENRAVTVSLLPDDDTTAEAGRAKIRAVHAIPDAIAVDVTADETVIADGVRFGETGGYVALPSDIGSVELRPDSASNDADPAATFSVDLPDTGAKTVFATGYLEPAGDQPVVRLVAATDAEPSSTPGGTATGTAGGAATPTGGM